MPNKEHVGTEEEKATWGDLLKLIAIVGVISIFMYIYIKDDRKTTKAKETQTTIDARTQDSLLRTVEYQNVVRASQELENKRAEIHRYFEENYKQETTK